MIIGRKKELAQLRDAYESEYSEFCMTKQALTKLFMQSLSQRKD